MKQSPKTSWGSVSNWYDTLLEEGEGTFQKEVILPNILRLLAVKPGQRVVDVGCGQGFFTRAFARAGAYATGIDISPELIAAAEAHLKKETGIRIRPQFMVAPANHMPGVASGSADAVTIILALQNIQEIVETLREAARILAPGGKLHIVLNHPAFRVPKASAWGWDEKTKTQYRRIDEYLSESKIAIDMHPGENKKVYTVSFHRPMQVYAKLLGKAGFGIVNMEEWISHRKGPKGKTFAALEKARKEIPIFMYLEAKKI